MFVYLNSLHNPFVYDDHRLIVDNTSLSAFPNLLAIALHEMTRPLVNLTYAVDHAVWGLDPFGYHVTNIALHAVNVALMFGLVWRWTASHATAHGPARLSVALVAGTAAVVFAVNPMMTQAVGYISGRSELLCATFMLLATGAAGRWLTTGRTRSAVATLSCWGAALLTKEVAVAFPFIVLAYDMLVQPTSVLPKTARFWRVHLPLLGIAGLLAIVRLWVLRAVEYDTTQIEPSFVLVQLEAVRRYAVLLLGQGPQSIFHQVLPFGPLWTLRSALTLLSAPAAWWLVRWLRRVDSLSALGVVWFLSCLLPSSLLFVLGRGEAMAEHRVYVASIGFFLVVGRLVGLSARVLQGQRLRTQRLAGCVGLVLIAQLGLHTVLRNTTWSDPVRLWRDAVVRAPGHWLPHLMLGEAYREQGRCDDAVPEYRTAIDGNPAEPFAYAKLGGCLLAQHDVQGAARVFTALQLAVPASVDAAAGLALVAVVEDRLDDAQRLLRDSVARDAGHLPARELLLALEHRDQPEHFDALCRQVLALAPGSPGAQACQRRAAEVSHD